MGLRSLPQRLIRNSLSCSAEFCRNVSPQGELALKNYTWKTPSFHEKYLIRRETTAFYEQNAFNSIWGYLGNLSAIAKTNEKAKLRELRKGFSYCQILRSMSWLLENGTFPDLQRCLYPLGWLASQPGRLRAVLHRTDAEKAREHLNQWRRELISQNEREQIRADRETDRAVKKFTAEYPTEPERRRAMIRVFNIHREKFGQMGLEEQAARALCIALLVSEIEASEIAQDRFSLAG